jgi:mono/diheme cytochrome c family protein
MVTYRGLTLALVLLAGCEDVIDLDPIDTRPPIEARVRPKPISGGTLTISNDGVAVAADPDRDVVYVVDVAQRSLRHTVALEAGDEPGRVAIGSDGLAHVVLRGFGGVATIDLAAGTVTERRHLCPDPRGIAFDTDDATLHVGCADGTLVHLPESGAPTRRQIVAPDVRDVMVVDGQVMVSLFREAVLVAEDGTRLGMSPHPRFEAHVAWHTRVHPSGSMLMVHQLHDTELVPINVGAEELVGESLPYGGGGGSVCEPGIASTAVSIFDGTDSVTISLPDTALAVDAAMDPEGTLVAVAVPGAEEGQPSVRLVSPPDGCFPIDVPGDTGHVTAVAFDPGGALVMQSREPARLVIQADPPRGGVEIIELGGESRYDSGHEIFHRATESGLSCASCHPEGGDDGHVWFFEGLGLRRTQALDIGLADTAPFHWDGDMVDLDMIMDEVLSHRMGGNRQSPERADSFTRWVFEQERPPADTGQEEAALVSEGAVLFATYDCGRCHTGPMLGGQTTEPIHGKELQVPSLRRVALRPPFMHDGRAHTLEEAVVDMIVATTSAEPVLEGNVAALTAYMRTL